MSNYSNEIDKIDLEGLINFHELANSLPKSKKIDINISGCPCCYNFNVDFSTDNISKIERIKWVPHFDNCKTPYANSSVDYLIRPDFIIDKKFSVLFLVNSNQDKIVKLLFSKHYATTVKEIINIQSGKIIANKHFVHANAASTAFERKQLFLNRLSSHLKKNYKLVILNFVFPSLTGPEYISTRLVNIQTFLDNFNNLEGDELVKIFSLLKETSVNVYYYKSYNKLFEKKLIKEAYGQTISTTKYKEKVKEALDGFNFSKKDSKFIDSKLPAVKFEIKEEDIVKCEELSEDVKEIAATRTLNQILLWEKFLVGEVPKDQPGNYIIAFGRTAFSRFNNLILDKKVIRLSKEHLPEIFSYNPRFFACNKNELLEKSQAGLINTLILIDKENLNKLYPDVKQVIQPRELVLSLIVDNLSLHIKNSVYEYLPLFFIKAAREIEVNKIENMNLKTEEDEKSIAFFNSSEEIIEAIIRKGFDATDKGVTNEFFKVAAELIINGWTLEISEKEEKEEYKLLVDLMEV